MRFLQWISFAAPHAPHLKRHVSSAGYRNGCGIAAFHRCPPEGEQVRLPMPVALFMPVAVPVALQRYRQALD